MNSDQKISKTKLHYQLILSITWADPEGGRDKGTDPPPLKIKTNIGFGADLLKNPKATMPAFNVGPPSARQAGR